MWKSVAVVGSGQAEPIAIKQAEEVGRLLAERGYAVVCGGLGGVMEAACRGARAGGGMTIGILPGYDQAAANLFVDIPIATGLSEARNAIVAAAATHAVIAIGGGFGTLSEIGFALKLGKPVVGLGSWELHQPLAGGEPILIASSPREAVHLATEGK